jgi:predicted N-acyltransferase
MKMDGYTTAVLDDLEKLPHRDKKSWDKIASSVFTKFEFIKIFEDENIIDIIPRHIVVYNKDMHLVGFAICYIENEGLYSTFGEGCYGKHHKLLNMLCDLNRTLVCYVPVGADVKAIEVSGDDAAIYDLIISKMQEIVKDEKLKQYAIYALNDKDSVLIDVLKKRKFDRIFSAFMNYVEIKWDSFDDYVNNLKHYKVVRRELKKNHLAGLKIEQARSKEEIEEVLNLIKRNFDKYYEGEMKLSSDLLLKFSKEFPDEIMFYRFVAKGEDVASSVYVLGNNFVNSWMGGHRQVDFENFIFFDMVIYEPIRIAIRNKVPLVVLGSHSYWYKKARGAMRYPVYIYVKSERWLNSLVFRLINRYKLRKHSKMLNFSKR